MNHDRDGASEPLPSVGEPAPENPNESPSMILSSERLNLRPVLRVRGGVRLRKKVITETVTQTVQIRREVLVREEIEAEDVLLQNSTANTFDELSDHEFQIVLHEERVTFSTQVVPVERIRVCRHVVTEQTDVAADIRHENAHVDI